MKCNSKMILITKQKTRINCQSVSVILIVLCKDTLTLGLRPKNLWEPPNVGVPDKKQNNHNPKYD